MKSPEKIKKVKIISVEKIREAIKGNVLLSADRTRPYGMSGKNAPSDEGDIIIPMKEYQLYWESNFVIVLKDDTIINLPWQETLFEKKKELNEKLKIVPKYKKLDILNEDRGLVLKKIIAEELLQKGGGTLYKVYHHILKGENPFVHSFSYPLKKILNKSFEEIEIEGKKIYYNIFELSELNQILEGITFTRFIPYIEEKIKELGGEIVQKNATNISWKNKTELCELIYALWKSERVLNNGNPIQQKDLITLFENFLNINLSKYQDLLSQTMGSFKRAQNNNYFLKELLEHAKNWKAKFQK